MTSLQRPFLVVGLLAAAIILPQSPLSAQTTASTSVERGCLQAAPADSLRTAAGSSAVIQHDAQGIYVFEAEATQVVSNWVTDTSHSGFSGAAYLRWNGSNHFNSPGNGTLVYRLWCDQPQRFRLQMHNRHDHSDPSEENDCWMSINGASWRKIYSNDNRNARVWNWHTRVDPGHGFFEFNLLQGMNELRVSGRSRQFMLDRIHIFPRGMGRLEDLNLPLSSRLRERPVIGTTVRLELGDPRDQASLRRGATAAFLMLSPLGHSGSCGIRIAGFGANGGEGELLLGVAVPPLMVFSGTWGGPSNPVVQPLPIPNDTSLVGSTVFTQGLLVSANGGQLRPVLTDRLDLNLGDV